MSTYLALHPVQAVAVAGLVALALLLLLIGISALILAGERDDDYRAAEYTRNITRNKTHGERL
jgi:hypothetical protein